MRIRITTIISLLLCVLFAHAKVQLPQLFQSGMVVQRGKKVPIWGTADPGERIAIRINKFQTIVIADSNGKFRADLPAMKAGGPYTLMVGDVVLTNVLVGDVWLCSGQSNMDVTIERVYPQYVEEINQLSNPNVRLFRVQNETNTHGVQEDIRPTSINWKPLTKDDAWLFSALGSFFGQRMAKQTGVPQGIIVNSWGGTPVEAWVSADSLEKDYPLYVEKTKLYQNDDYVKAQARANQLADQRWYEIMNESDPGIQEHFILPNYDDSAWETVNQYSMEWAKKNGRGIIGSIWLRQHIQVDKAHAGKPARLLLGTLFDADYTYLNGKEIGRTYYQYPPRRYDIPEGLLREGDNVITIRFVNKYGTAHFIKEKPYMIAFGDDRCSLNPLPKDVIPLSEQWKHHAGAEMPSCPSGDVSLQNLPTTLYNAVVYPLAPYAISGVVWYQGESNTGNPAPYADLLQKMIGNWRTLWKSPRLPFCVVQLANHLEPSEQPQPYSGWAQLREAQRQVAANDPYTALAVAVDLGETVDIHPLRKKEVAERVGLCMDQLVYGKKVALSPQPVSAKREGNQVVVTFDQPLQEGEQAEFELAGADKRFVNVKAVAKGNQVSLESTISAPAFVRYAWKDNPIRANLYSKHDLPATPFELQVTE
ncbi:MAG: sialate O-acetylesterase [Prevotella sp.]|nr:sialate O-acetylesterase [Prevotella sp.]